MNTNVWIKTSLAGAVALTLAACGSRGGDIDIGAPFKSLLTTASATNPIVGSACGVVPFNNRTTSLDSGSTDTAGKIDFEIPEATTITLIRCSGGTFTAKVTAGNLSSVVPTDLTTAQVNAFTSVFAAYLVAQPVSTITSLADLVAQTANIFKALGLEGTSYSNFIAGTLSAEATKQIALFIITLANNPDLAQRITTAVVNGFISSTLATELNLALQATAARLPPSELPATIPVVIGGSTTPTGGTGTGGST